MGMGGQEKGESSKNQRRRSKRQLKLAALAATLPERNGGVRILDRENVEVREDAEVAREVEVARTLQEMNCVARRSNRLKSAEVPPTPPVIPYNSTSQPNINTTNSPNPQNSASPANSSILFAEKAVQVDSKKKRGKTMMKTLSLTPNERVEVEFNALGQPIGLNSTHLSSFLGTLAREMVPVNISDWRKVDKSLKDDMWTCIQTRFKLEPLHKDLLIKMLGHRWKEAKSRLVSAIREAFSNPDASNKLAMLKPDNMKSVTEWNEFIKEKLSEEFLVKSKKFKAIRAKNNIPHTMSRKGYARLAEEMEIDCSSGIDRDDLWVKGHTKKNGEPSNSVVVECIAKIKEHSNTESYQETVPPSEDGVLKTFGRERFEVTPSQLGVHLSYSKKVFSLENQVIVLQRGLQELTDLFMATVAGKGNATEDPLTPRTNTFQPQRGSNNFANGDNMHTKDLPKKCKLLNWQKNVVAEGTLASTDPTVLVHQFPIGPDVWKVWVDVALEPQALLWKANSEMSTIQQAVGTTVAWHKDFISFN